MQHTSNLDGVSRIVDEDKPVVTDAQPQFFHSLECFHIALARTREAMQGGENAHSGGFVQAADIGLGPVQSRRFASLRFFEALDLFLSDPEFG
jgi:hypothetical protein